MVHQIQNIFISTGSRSASCDVTLVYLHKVVHVHL